MKLSQLPFIFFLSSYLVQGEDDTSLTTSFFESVGEGASNQVGSDVVGYGLSSIGLANGNTKQLQQINQQLANISSTLTTMESDLTELVSAVNQADCDMHTDDLDKYTARIDDMQAIYNGFLLQAQNYETPATTCDQSEGASGCMENWANGVLGGLSEDDNLLDALSQINSLLMDTGGLGHGAILACSQTLPINQGDFDDSYWDNLYNFLEYFYNYQTRALSLIVEAFHYRAWTHAGSPTGDSLDYTSICSDTCKFTNNANATSQVHTACTQAYSETTTTYQNIWNQYALAGAPYNKLQGDASPFRLQYRTDKGPNALASLYPKSLEAFTKAQGSSSCPTPLPSDQPCGYTAISGHDQYYHYASGSSAWVYGYNEWTPANQDDLKVLVTGITSHQRYGDYLNTLGFENMNNKVIGLNNFVPVNVGVNGCDHPLSGELHCFYDMDNTPEDWVYAFCDTKAVNDYLLDQYAKKGCGCNAEYGTCGHKATLMEEKKKHSVSGRGTWYEAKSHLSNGYTVWETTPGWWYTSNFKQYSLPTIHLENMPCKNGFQTRNNGGAFTMCGDDIESFLNARIPKPPAMAPNQCPTSPSRKLRGGQV